MRVLVTGTDGYLGTLVAPYLMGRGHEVTGVDTGYYKEGWLYHGQQVSPRTLAKDLRRLEVEDLRGYDAIVLGADKWHQLHDPRFYGGSEAAMRTALHHPLRAVRALRQS